MGKKKKRAKRKAITQEDLGIVPRFILGLDPSLDGTGYCVLDCLHNNPKIAETGVVKGRTETWSDDTPTQVKLAVTQAKVKELRAKYEPLFPIVFLEKGFTKYNNSTQATFRARGVIEAELIGLHIVEFAPNEVKNGTTGNGSASKEEVQKCVAQLLGVDPSIFPTYDASDATAVAYLGYLKYFKSLVRKEN